MKETGIIMTGNHPKLILDGTKTQTRRVLKPQPDLGLDEYERYSHIEVGKYHPALIDKDGEMYPGDEIFGAYTDDGEWGWKSPYGQVGDRLWVRETWYQDISGGLVCYKADYPIGDKDWPPNNTAGKIKPSIFMPRWASRITLEITEVRVERVQGISPADCSEEGINRTGDIIVSGKDMRGRFSKLWDSLNAKCGYGWEVNPWVWVISFKVMK